MLRTPMLHCLAEGHHHIGKAAMWSTTVAGDVVDLVIQNNNADAFNGALSPTAVQ
jgi:hypothetical protein